MYISILRSVLGCVPQKAEAEANSLLGCAVSGRKREGKDEQDKEGGRANARIKLVTT